MEKLIKFTIGDWSGDGHGKKEDIYIRSNCSSERLKEALFRFQKKHDIYFVDSDGEGKPVSSKNKVCDAYEEGEITKELFDKLQALSIDMEQFTSEDLSYMLDPDHFLALMLTCVRLEIQDFEWEEVNDFAESFNGGDSELQETIGYGLF